MKKQPPEITHIVPQDDDDQALFRQAFGDVKPLKQDKILPPPKKSTRSQSQAARHQAAQAELKQASASFHFSDGYEAHFDAQGPLKYVRPGADSYQIKRLRRGQIPPELILDLHGLSRNESKLEVAALIEAARKQHFDCVCIVHGIGSLILKQTVPSWLVQHPAVLGFHQAPLEWGGQGALLVLIDLPRSAGKY